MNLVLWRLYLSAVNAISVKTVWKIDGRVLNEGGTVVPPYVGMAGKQNGGYNA